MHVIRKTGGIVYYGSGSVGMDAVELCKAITEGDKGGVHVTESTDATVGDASGERRRGKLSVPRDLCRWSYRQTIYEAILR